MNTPATQTPALPPGPAILAAMQCAILDALPPHPGASEAQKAAQREGALEFLAALHPRNAMEATLAAGIVVAHFAAMDCFRRAAQGGLTVDLHLRIVGKAIALCRMINVQMRDLARRQGGIAVQPAARPASVRSAPVQAGPVQPLPEPGADAQPAPEATRASTPPQPPVAEGRHERRRRERAERHAAAAAQRAGRGSGAADIAARQRLAAEIAARAAASAVVAAA